MYHEVTAPERTVQTFEFEGVPGHVLLDTARFEDFDGKTKLTQQSVFQSVEDRDGMVQSGMEEGSTESMDRLAGSCWPRAVERRRPHGSGTGSRWAPLRMSREGAHSVRVAAITGRDCMTV